MLGEIVMGWNISGRIGAGRVLSCWSGMMDSLTIFTTPHSLLVLLCLTFLLVVLLEWYDGLPDYPHHLLPLYWYYSTIYNLSVGCPAGVVWWSPWLSSPPPPWQLHHPPACVNESFFIYIFLWNSIAQGPSPPIRIPCEMSGLCVLFLAEVESRIVAQTTWIKKEEITMYLFK